MMEKWEDLKIYRNLPPEEIPTCFKEFAHFICDKLSPDGFRLKESKSEKRLFRFNADFEQTIYFENTSRVKNQKEVRIYVSIKPLFTDKPDIPWWLFQGFEIAPAFKMSYPLTKEYLLLAAHLLERIQQYILPFFDQYATVDQVVAHHQKLLTHYKLPHDGSIPENATALRLIYESAFRVRNKDVFTRCYMKYLQQTQEAYAQFKDDPTLGPLYLNDLEDLKTTKRFFDDDVLYKQEIERQDGRALEYVASFDKKKAGR